MTPPAPPQGAKKMSPEQMRAAIAEACGWRYSPTAAPEMKLVANMRWIGPGRAEWHETELPDYLNDLNAAHDALIALIDYDADEFSYRCNLTTACGHDEGLTLFASAEQICEALLKTKGLWRPAP